MNWEYWWKILAVFICVYTLSYVLRKIIGLIINRQSNKVNVDPTNFNFLKNSISFAIFLTGIIIVFYITPSLRTISKALFAGAGILAAIIGFASQKALGNIFSGIFILIFRPFRVRDFIEIGSSNKGIVEEITLRHTIIRNLENRRIIIPNSIISEETIVNSSIIDTKVRRFIEFGISYDSDVDVAKKIIFEEAVNHPLTIDNRTDEEIASDKPKVIIRVVNLGEYSVTIRANVWAASHIDSLIINWDMNESVRNRFNKEGVEIPYPHRTIICKQ